MTSRESEEGLGAPLVQAAAHTNHVIDVYADRVEVRSGWKGQSIESVDLREIDEIRVSGLVNCTLKVTTNRGRVLTLQRMALPDARAVKKAVEDQKRRAGLYD